jgi:hypothetical protein
MPTKVTLVFWEYILKDKTQYNGKALLEIIHELRGKVLAY